MTPLILVTADVRALDRYVWHGAVDTYLKAVAGMGGVPLILPSLPGALDLDALLARIDGVLLTGSRSNVHPETYGAAASQRHEPYDRERDAAVLPLIRRTLEHGVPLLAVCRGFQELNVALGGSLVAEAQERPGSLDHRGRDVDDNDIRFALAHRVAIEPGSRLAGIVGAGEIAVNSVHRQAVDRLAPGLVVEARAPDGTIEAVRVADARGFALGVQWHPEYWAATDAPSQAIFAAFGRAARSRMASRLAQAAE